MNLGQMLLSPSGRVSRRGYWIFTICVAALYLVVLYATADTYFEPGGNLPHAILALVLLWPTIAMGIKRAHDRGWGWWFIILAFVPIINIWPIIEFLFLRGQQGDNEYGADPATETRSTWWIWVAAILLMAGNGYVVSKLMDGASGQFEALQNSLQESADDSSDNADEAAGAAGEAASGAADAAADAAESASDTAGDAADTATDAAGDAMDQASDAASSAADAASDAASSAADTASDAMDEAQDKASDTASDAKSKMNDAMGAN